MRPILSRQNDSRLKSATSSRRERSRLTPLPPADKKSEEQILSVLSHEFRTPLSVILGYADLLKTEVSDEHTETVRAIIQSGQSLLTTLNSVLEWLEIAEEKQFVIPDNFNVGSVFDSVISRFRPASAEKGVRLVGIAPAGSITMISDEGRLRNVLGYLVDNAVKFTSDGEIRFSMSPTDRAISFVLSDTGIGMSEEKLARLSAPFSQGSIGDSRRFSGLGLGLTLALEGIRLLQGTVSFEKRESGGTRIELSFPRVLKTHVKRAA